MKDKKIEEKVKREMNIIDRLRKYAVRTYLQLLVHVFVAIVLAVLVYVFWGRCVVINSSNFTVITSSMSAACGVLLAVSITLAIFLADIQQIGEIG